MHQPNPRRRTIDNADQQNDPIAANLDRLEQIACIEKCRGCRCFSDTLSEFGSLIDERATEPDIRTRLSRIRDEVTVMHGCLGCDPCFPVPVSMALVEMGGRAEAAACDPRMPRLTFRGDAPRATVPQSVWPIEPGEYIIGSATSPVAVCTLGSDTLAPRIEEQLGGRFAIIGKLHTENIGIEKLVRNVVANPSIRFLILCGQETRGHASGAAIIALMQNGLDGNRRIIGAAGQRPYLRNCSSGQIDQFRSQIECVSLIGTEDVAEIARVVAECIDRDPGMYEHPVSIAAVPLVEASVPHRLALDPAGFFIIHPDRERHRIHLEHYLNDGSLNKVIHGDDPAAIAITAIEHGLLSRLDHAAYLGRELHKAAVALLTGGPYVQDSAPGIEDDEGTTEL